MKHLFYLVFCGFIVVQYTNALRCWECRKARTNAECLRKGRLSTCLMKDATCEDHIRHEDFGKYTTYEKRCKQRLACINNLQQNARQTGDPSQCSISREHPTSVCQCCCDKQECNRDLRTCLKSVVKGIPQLYRQCKDFPDRPATGDRQCSGNRKEGSTCTFTCHNGYFLKGPRSIKCLDDGTWPEAPNCVPARCKLLSTPINGVMRCTSTNSMYSTCKLGCKRGYRLQGMARLQCTTEGNGAIRSWSGPLPTCVSLPKCPTLKWRRHPQRSCRGFGGAGTSCSYKCKKGFKLVGISTIRCLRNLHWNHAQPTCHEMACDPLPIKFNHGNLKCDNQNKLLSSCKFACKPGFTIRGQSSIRCREDAPRSGNGQWTSPFPMCEGNRCRSIAALEFGSMDCSGPLITEVVCNFRCREGYRLYGDSSITCQPDGSWDGQTPNCERIACDKTLQSDPNGYMLCKDFRYLGSVCRFNCNGNWELLGNETSTCVEHPPSSDQAVWSHSPPTCFLDTCEEVDAPENGFISCGDDPLYIGIAECLFTCEPSYYIKGPTTISCGLDKEWDQLPPTCGPVTCPSLPPDTNGQLSCTSSGLDEKCRVLCNANYRLVGTKEVNCEEHVSDVEVLDPSSGLWSEQPGYCEALVCEKLAVPSFATIICTNEEIVIGTICYIECEYGFYSKGYDEIKCVKNRGLDGKWDKHSLPSCEVLICPQMQGGISNGVRKCTDGNELGSICTFNCNGNWELLGNETSTCVEHPTSSDQAVWSHSPPTCFLDTCEEVDAPENGFISCGDDPLYIAIAECQFTCEPSYYIKGPTTISCGLDKEWDQLPPTCGLVTCPSLPPDTNGQLSCTSSGLDEKCRVLCNANYRLVGTKEVNCEENVSDVEVLDPSSGLWSEQPGYCEALVCEKLAVPSFATIICTNEEIVIGTICYIECEYGFYSKGYDEIKCVKNRGLDGKWDKHSLPSCEVIICPQMQGGISNGVRKCTDGNEFGSICTYRCEAGYKKNGIDDVTCVDDELNPKVGKWNIEEPTCERIMCNKLAAPDHSTMRCTNGIKLGSECRVKCDVGYHLVGRFATRCKQDGFVGLWNNEQPTCEAIICAQPLDAPTNGTKLCDKGNNLGSVCKYTCNGNYRRVGASTVTCVDDPINEKNGIWDNQQPTCEGFNF